MKVHPVKKYQFAKIMHYANNEKRDTTYDRRNGTTKSRKN